MAVFDEVYLTEFLGIRFSRSSKKSKEYYDPNKNPELKKTINEIVKVYQNAIKKSINNDKLLKDKLFSISVGITHSPKEKRYTAMIKLFDIQWEEICKDLGVKSENYNRDHNDALIIYKEDPNASKAFEKCKKELKRIKSSLKSVEESFSDEYNGIAYINFWPMINPGDDNEYVSWDDEYAIGSATISVNIEINKLLKKLEN